MSRVAASLDFPVAETVVVDDADALRDALASASASASATGVRVMGSGSAQGRIPAPIDRDDDAPAADGAAGVTPNAVTIVSLSGMRSILRLEADDLTCSVEAGTPRAELDAALTEKGLYLPCAGSGTIGGIFAADEWGPTGPAKPEPRTLLLGMTALLAEGKRFRSGARVVKNVAGFDLQKLFVGSRGRLFVVTEMHLKLRPLPRATLHFARGTLSPDEAVELAARLRTLPARPDTLLLRRTGTDGCEVLGTFTGHPQHLERLERDLALPRTSSAPELDGILEPPRQSTWSGLETVRGQIPSRNVNALLSRMPEALFAMCGERFSMHLSSESADGLLAWLPEVGGAGELVFAAPERRGRGTSGDSVAARLDAELASALDPKGVLR